MNELPRSDPVSATVLRSLRTTTPGARRSGRSFNITSRVPVKVIFETALLDDDAIVLACEAAVEAGADFVKTSTGFSTAGATVEHVALMRRTVGERIGVKASGGVRTRADALAMIEAGATRIGASSALAILGSD